MVRLANPQPQTSQLQNILWAALNKVGQKELDASLLPESTSHDVCLQVHGTIDGRSITKNVQSVVEIGPSQTKISSVNPQVTDLIASILSKLNAATRNRILNDLPAEFESLGEMPTSEPAIVAQTKSMLKHLRQQKTVVARGPIRCNYTVTPVDEFTERN